MTTITPNCNFYSLSGTIHTDASEEYRNYRKAWLELPQTFTVRDFPMHLDLEASSRCNLKCSFCDKLPLMQKGQLGDMDFNLFQKIIDEGADRRLWGVKLSYRGEPLLNSRIVDMASYAVRKGIIEVYFNTNGMLLDLEMAYALSDAGLHRISISVEGTDPIAFEKQRIGASFATIFQNIESLRELRIKRGVNHPKIRVQTVLFPNLDIEQYRTYWEQYCDEVAAIDFKDESCRVTGIEQDWGCPQLWQRMTVEWDGTVFPCNNDDLRNLSVGNAWNRSIGECWHDQRVEKIRQLHRSGKSHKVSDCDGCPWRSAQLNKIERSRRV